MRLEAFTGCLLQTLMILIINTLILHIYRCQWTQHGSVNTVQAEVTPLWTEHVQREIITHLINLMDGFMSTTSLYVSSSFSPILHLHSEWRVFGQRNESTTPLCMCESHVSHPCDAIRSPLSQPDLCASPLPPCLHLSGVLRGDYGRTTKMSEYTKSLNSLLNDKWKPNEKYYYCDFKHSRVSRPAPLLLNERGSGTVKMVQSSFVPPAFVFHLHCWSHLTL